MFWVNFKRIAKTGFVNFWRNTFVSVSSVLVMIVTLFVIGLIILSGALLNYSLDAVKNKVDINVYFVNSAQESEILAMKKNLEALPQVKQVEYVSREAAIEAFKTRHENNEIILQALDELNDNPLGAILNVRAKDPSQYESISNFLDQNGAGKGGDGIIEKVNYAQNKFAIDKLSAIISSGTKLGFIVAMLLIIISIMISFNTIRLVIYMARDEISVMKLVGASNWYVRGPFIVGGIMYGAISAIITIVLFFPFTYWLGPITDNFFIGMNIFHYYLSYWWEFLFIILLTGVFVGAVSSFWAVKKYLQV
ncbi:ABC transporter permease [Candidatus Nomurabacteria bacterium]|nr:ABC transporter permease [Candidatus Nomurabacteria bacterium]